MNDLTHLEDRVVGGGGSRPTRADVLQAIRYAKGMVDDFTAFRAVVIDALTAIDVRLDTAEAALVSLATRLDAAEASLADLDTRLSAVEASLVDIGTRLDDIEARVTALESPPLP